jgi:hypothetical protein
MRDKYLEYARRKKEIEKRNLSPQEDDRLILLLVKELGI